MSTNHAARAYELIRQVARAERKDVQSTAILYTIQRFLARLAAFDPTGAVTVKGGNSLGIVFGNLMRPTKDVDLNFATGGLDNPEVWLQAMILAAAGNFRLDGVDIDVDNIVFERREHQGKGGLRIRIPARVHTCRTDFVVDVGMDNEMTFDPKKMFVPGILAGHRNAPEPLRVRVYPLENTIAEKILAKIEDGTASIRHKDLFDLWLCVEIMRRAGDLRLVTHDPDELTEDERVLAAEVKSRLADGKLLEMPTRDVAGDCLDRLALALTRTAASRGTELPADVSAYLLEEFGGDRIHSGQWANWCRNQKDRLRYQPPGTGKGDDRDGALRVLLSDIAPVLSDISERAAALSSNPSP